MLITVDVSQLWRSALCSERHNCETSTDHYMTDASKYRKMSYLVMFRKVEK